MHKILTILLSMIACIGSVKSQVSTGAKTGLMDHFHSFNTIQVLNGSTTTSAALNTVNGFQSGNFFGGIGTGFDYYYLVSVPLFIEGRFSLVQRKGILQVFADGGLNIPFASQKNKQEFETGPYKPGVYYGSGFDYLIPHRKDAIMLGVGFSSKQVIQLVDNNIWDPVLNRVENSPIKNKYSLNCITIRAGWMF